LDTAAYFESTNKCGIFMEKYGQLSLRTKFFDNHDILMTYFEETL